MPKHTSNIKITLMNPKKKKLSNERTESSKVIYRILNIHRKLTKDALPR